MQAMKSLTLGEFVEVEREGWFVIDRTKAAERALEMHGDVGPDPRAFADRGRHGNALRLLARLKTVLPQGRQAGRRNGDFKMPDQ